MGGILLNMSASPSPPSCTSLYFAAADPSVFLVGIAPAGLVSVRRHRANVVVSLMASTNTNAGPFSFRSSPGLAAAVPHRGTEPICRRRAAGVALVAGCAPSKRPASSIAITIITATIAITVTIIAIITIAALAVTPPPVKSSFLSA